MSHIKVGYFQIVIVANKQVVEFQVHMGDAVVMDEFKTFNQLSKISSGQFFINIFAVLFHEAKEIAVDGIFGDDVRNLLFDVFKSGFSFALEIEVSDDIGVLERGKSGLILVVQVGFAVGVAKDLHGVGFLGDF